VVVFFRGSQAPEDKTVAGEITRLKIKTSPRREGIGVGGECLKANMVDYKIRVALPGQSAQAPASLTNVLFPLLAGSRFCGIKFALLWFFSDLK
jgi:hypothetical protein